ncbi:hypothetical protein GCM10011392_11290 [Wenxinia marina]|nr:hypothetical protein GCM10011392_11290 [Wenxinia marina]
MGTDCLRAPPINWSGGDTYIQKTGISRDPGTFDAPDNFFAIYAQDLGALRDWLFRHAIRHWKNARVRAIRGGSLLPIDGAPENRPGISRVVLKVRAHLCLLYGE